MRINKNNFKLIEDSNNKVDYLYNKNNWKIYKLENGYGAKVFFNKVDFPLPLSPVIATNSPIWNSRFTFVNPFSFIFLVLSFLFLLLLILWILPQIPLLFLFVRVVYN